MKNLSDIRREYSRSGLRRKDLDTNPISMFESWLQQAIDADIVDPTAMVLATSDSRGVVSQRIVLLKEVDEQGFVFFTSYDSDKARAMADNKHVSLHFPWHGLERQVSVIGVVEKISSEASESYFRSRPLASQVAAIASPQSQVIPSRESLTTRYQALCERYQDTPLPMPGNWGGYRVLPEKIEFWQGGEYRLHDRFRYTAADGQWHIDRLAP